jgi:iron complex outermembrane recepter protein
MKITLRSVITATLTVALNALTMSALEANAQTAPNKAPDNTGQLAEVVVTGSLIKHVATETAEPITVITAADMAARGFTSIADALQQSAFSTGSVQGPQASYGFTQGARTISMFGLSPSYVKYLIDGLPMSDYPALYNGTDTFVSIGGIPMSLVDRIEVLPGGQSSLYGSDAIAGVVNIIMKKNIDGPTADVRYGFTRAGGGTDRTISLSNGWTHDQLTLMGGIQYDKTDPIWGFERGLTSKYNTQGTSPATASRDYAVFGLNGRTMDGFNDYYFEDPNNCRGVANLYHGTEAFHTRDNHGSYCGTTEAGFYTINSLNEESDIYLRATYQVNPTTQVYADILASHNKTGFSNGLGTYYSNSDTNSSVYNYWDPNVGDNLSLQHNYSPEEIGNISDSMSYSITENTRYTLGMRGALTDKWEVEIAGSFNQQKLIEQAWNLLTDPTESFYAPIYGPNLGLDPKGVYQTYAPNYSLFYVTISPDQLASLNGYAVNHSRTQSTLFRSQLTNSQLFKLPGGDAGLAFVSELGHQIWDYTADPGFATNKFFGLTSSGSSEGNRRRSSFTTELRLPVLDTTVVDLSGRYDDYILPDTHVSKTTYMAGVEYRPIPTVLARARVGTAFKAPTLSDQYQTLSGAYTGATDYYQCTLHGQTGPKLADCPYPNTGYVFLQTSGNTQLKPINAKVWNAGLVWDATRNLSFDLDYLHWAINNEVSEQSLTKLLETESDCRLGNLPITSPTCIAAISQVTRDSDLQLVSAYTPKVNVALETVNALTVKAHYHWDTEHWGKFDTSIAWNDMLKHDFQQYAGDTVINLLSNPFYSTDFKSKVNGSLSWEINDFSTTAYVNRDGRTPNYLATTSDKGYATDGAGTLAPFYSMNLSAGYAISPTLSVTGRIVNVFNAMPPFDRSYSGNTSQPYNIYNYDPYGRSFQLEFAYRAH